MRCKGEHCPLSKSAMRSFGTCCNCNVRCREEAHHSNPLASCRCHDYYSCPCHPSEPFIQAVHRHHLEDIAHGLVVDWNPFSLEDFPKVFLGIHRPGAWGLDVPVTIPLGVLVDEKCFRYKNRQAVDQALRLHPRSRVLCTFCSRDPVIEKCWPNYRDICRRLASFEFDYYAADYSCFKTTATAGILWNFARNLLIQREFQDLGCAVIPRLTTLAPMELAWMERAKPGIVFLNLQMVSKSSSQIDSCLHVILSCLEKRPMLRVVFYGLEHHRARLLYRNPRYSFAHFGPQMSAVFGREWPSRQKRAWPRETIFEMNYDNYLKFMEGEGQ